MDMDLNSENLTSNSFLQSTADIIDVYNKRIKDENIELDELSKLSKQLIELNAFYVTLKSQIIENRDEISTTKLKEIGELYVSYNTTLNSVKELKTLFANKAVEYDEAKVLMEDSFNSKIHELDDSEKAFDTLINNKIYELNNKVLNGEFNGKDFKFEDFTPEQLKALQIEGKKGDTFTFDDLTPEQIEILKGKDFKFENFTPEQLKALKVKGDKGEQGEAGSNGINGQDGKDGINGENGLNGNDGKSSYELAKENGFVGTLEEYLESLKANQEDIGWKSLVPYLLNGWVAFDDGERSPEYRKIGDIVFLRGLVKGGDATSILGGLPYEIRPKKITYLQPFSTSSNFLNKTYSYIAPSGLLVVHGYDSLHYTSLSCSYLVN